MTKPAAKRPTTENSAIHEGMALFNARRLDEACARLRAASKSFPKSADAAAALAHALEGSGRAEESVAAYEKARKLAPKDAGVAMSLARLYLRLGEKAKAEALLRKAVALKAGPEAALVLGETLKERGAPEAKAFLKRAAADKSGSVDPHALLAAGLTRFRANVKLGAFAEAFAEADALLAAQGTQECIDSFFVSPEPSELMPTLEALKAFSVKNPANPWPRFFRAGLLSNMGRGEEAIAETERLTKSEPKHHWMRHKHGELLLTNRRDYPAAEAEYAAALASVPGFWKARAALAEIALCRGDRARALTLSAELVEALPERIKAWGRAAWGKLLLWSGDYPAALVQLEAAVAAGIPYSRRHRGAALLLLGRLDEAAADLEEGLRQGVDAEGLTWRGELRLARGDFKGAIEDLSAAIRMDGANSFWALADRALARGASGEPEGLWADFKSVRRDVLDCFEKAAAVKADEPSKTAEARAALEAGLKLGRGVRVANEYLFPVWMGDGR